MSKIPIGIQTFTVREELKADFKGTMKALAGMGYRGVELGSDTGGMAPKELAAFIKSIGLLVPGIHGSTADLSNPAAAVYEYAAATGARFVTTSRDRDVPKWDSVIEEVKTAAQVAKSKGLQFTYHNHSAEFTKIDGKYALDILFEKTDPALVQCELDTYWIKKGGEDPVAYIRKHKGRCPEIHLKDMDASDGSFTEVGNGMMDLPAIFNVAGEVGAQWMIVEQDFWKRPAMESARVSIENLKERGLA